MLQRLRLLKLHWWIMLFVPLLALGVLTGAAIIIDEQNNSGFATKIRTLIGDGNLMAFIQEIGPFVSNDLVAGALIAMLSASISMALIQIFQIPRIRNTAIRAIAFGYYENFLKKLVAYVNSTHSVYRIVLIMPRFELISQPEVYWQGVKSQITRMGFEMKTAETDMAFGRNTFMIMKKQSPSLPLYIDVPTTTRTLQELLELEAHMPVGTSKNTQWFRRRFGQLRDEFAQAIRDYYPEDALPSLVILNPMSQTDFQEQLRNIIHDLEAELEGQN